MLQHKIGIAELRRLPQTEHVRRLGTAAVEDASSTTSAGWLGATV
jgi:hypothetical protein